jgi:hypothetical protein
VTRRLDAGRDAGPDHGREHGGDRQEIRAHAVSDETEEVRHAPRGHQRLGNRPIRAIETDQEDFGIGRNPRRNVRRHEIVESLEAQLVENRAARREFLTEASLEAQPPGGR